MRNAEKVLAIIRERGKRGLPLEDAYRQLFNPDLYLRAYGRISRNAGALTQGATSETADEMSLEKIGLIIEAVRYERYRWTPVRRTHIPKRNGKTRPLGIPTWSDKLLQEVIRSLLEAYYEPQLSDHAHGFRPNRGCHTALQEVQHTWRGAKWFIEGDIKGCFDNIDHQVLVSILGEKIHDNRFLRLIENLLKAGYLEDWKRFPTFSGTPQGGIVSPILANIYLDRLDKFVETVLLPAYNRGKARKTNLEYARVSHQRRGHRQAGRVNEAKACLRQMRALPSKNQHDPAYRRLRYVRYADDFLLGFAGPKAEAQDIKAELTRFLREQLKLELSPEKTLITHATQEKARFLGYDIASQRVDDKIGPRNRRSNNGSISLRVPAEVVETLCNRYKKAGKPIHRVELTPLSDYHITAHYQSEYRGYVQYYALAQNIGWLDKLRWTMEGSLLKTLASKHKVTVSRIAQRYRSTVRTPYGLRSCLAVTVEREGKRPLVARFGGIALRPVPYAILEDQRVAKPRAPRALLEQRLTANVCEWCGSTQQVQVHHIRKLADLKEKGRGPVPRWKQVMSAMQRKTLVVCHNCHRDIHAGRPFRNPPFAANTSGEPDDAKVSSPVRGGAIGKGAE